MINRNNITGEISFGCIVVNDARISHSDDGCLPSSEIMSVAASHGALKSIDTDSC